MRRLVLDTHVLLWWLESESNLTLTRCVKHLVNTDRNE